MSESEKVERVHISLPSELREQIDAQLDYGDERSEWIREACRRKLNRDIK